MSEKQKLIIQTYDRNGTNKSAISKTNRNRQCQELYSIDCEANQIGDHNQVVEIFKGLS